MSDFFDVSTIRIILALLMLGIASFLDLKYREVHDYLWIGFGAIAGILILFEGQPESFLVKLGYSLIIAPIVIVLWRMGLFGGADSFGLIVLAALAPLISFSDNIVTPLTVLTNAVVLSLAVPITNVARNLKALLNNENIFAGFNESKNKKILAFFLGYRAKKPTHGFTIEKNHGAHKSFDFSLHHSENTPYSTKADSWVTPGNPFLIYVAGGFILQLAIGDIILNFMLKFFS